MKRMIRLVLLYLGLAIVFVINTGPVDGSMGAVKVTFEYQQF